MHTKNSFLSLICGDGKVFFIFLRYFWCHQSDALLLMSRKMRFFSFEYIILFLS